MEDRELRNPFRSEADAFRLLLLIGLGVLAVVLAAVLGGGWVGLAVAVVLLAIAARATFRWLQASVAERERTPEQG
jgi:uncharacterized membrane protein YjjP (DUF1212 family)